MRDQEILNAPCADCGVETLPTDEGRAEFYMIHDRLWDSIMDGPGWLCVGCAEARLGRRLVAADFTDAPINDALTYDTPRYAWSYRTARLQDRLVGEGQ